jgi:hypothetical protein
LIKKRKLTHPKGNKNKGTKYWGDKTKPMLSKFKKGLAKKLRIQEYI